eukprot:COSAG01_NODE_2112_length_8403_cov_15.894027_5_plen_52_part_00
MSPHQYRKRYLLHITSPFAMEHTIVIIIIIIIIITIMLLILTIDLIYFFGC